MHKQYFMAQEMMGKVADLTAVQQTLNDILTE